MIKHFQLHNYFLIPLIFLPQNTIETTYLYLKIVKQSKNYHQQFMISQVIKPYNIRIAWNGNVSVYRQGYSTNMDFLTTYVA